MILIILIILKTMRDKRIQKYGVIFNQLQTNGEKAKTMSII